MVGDGQQLPPRWATPLLNDHQQGVQVTFVIDHLEADLAAKLKNTQALRQAILRHAFTGQLVPQDPNGEPASKLLKRIAAEREARARVSAGKPGTRNRKRRASSDGRLPA